MRFYQSIGSTNDVALDWLREGGSAGSVVIADEQTKGRGRLGRSWFAPPGSALMLSVLLKPPVDDVGRVTMAGAVAIAELLEHLGAADVGIKWPNDVRLNGRKVCGVLPEAAWDGPHLLGVILGMGLNVRIDFAGSGLEDSAISIEPALGHFINRLDALKFLLSRVDEWAARLGSHSLYAAWKRRLVTVGQPVTVNAVDGLVQGRAEAVDEHGALLVRTGEGIVKRIVAGDIALGETRGRDGH